MINGWCKCDPKPTGVTNTNRIFSQSIQSGRLVGIVTGNWCMSCDKWTGENFSYQRFD